MKMADVVTWIVIADGSRAKVFKNEGPGTGLVPALDEDLVGSKLATRDINADKPGRTFDSADVRRHSKEPPTDPHRHMKDEFAHHVADVLRTHALDNSYDKLVIVAAPQALGDIRKHLDKAAKEKVVAEMDKDLMWVPVDELASHLGDAVSV